MEKNNIKHLVVALGGIGLCIAGPQVSNWYIMVSKDSMVSVPFQIIGVVLVITGIFCCIGAMLCQLGRYNKK